MTLHQITASSDDLKTLRQLLDLAVRGGGLPAAPAATFWLQRIEMAEKTPLPLPNRIEAVEAESHGPHFPPPPQKQPVTNNV